MPPPLTTSSSDNLVARLTSTFTTSTDCSNHVSFVAKYADLTSEETKIADDWLPRLYQCNRMEPLDTAEKKETARKHIWALVFSNNWNSNCIVPAPAKAPERTACQSTIQVGTLNRDAEQAKKKRRDGSMAPIPLQRSRGAAVFIKVNIHWIQEDMTFPLCDAKGSNFSTDIDYARLPNLNYWQAKGDCTATWDRAQLRRIGGQNTELVVHWIRNALKFSLKHRNRGRECTSPGKPADASNSATVTEQPAMPIYQTVDLGRLTFINLCADI
ncbi:hypothetical protein CTA2_5459 [Colletotrichum tanaceti]|uniref:Uncharacterized protein n=1 Tax=Colletotrichum tanaceti TaxID=1306861 RepID=A0A4U6XBE7_9PEZI|nr:hypothetical protein CTA2_5459 [Colletotrichum tanaceti]TKW53021.1 hypothetical protein CTA1_6833 [Colletotrichum tanaceti]